MKEPGIVGLVVWLMAGGACNIQAQPVLISNHAAMAGQPSYNYAGLVTISAFYGETNSIPNALINSDTLAYIGVNSNPGDGNFNAINDRDTTFGGTNQERLRLEIAAGHYVSELTWQWSRADGPLATDGVTISGFNGDPGAVFSGGVLASPAPTYSAGKLNFQITGFSGINQTITFANPAATTNATLEITVADSTQANPQFAMRNFSVAPVASIPRRVNLARYQSATASSVNGQFLADYVNDGVVGNMSWRTDNLTTPHWAEVAFPVPVTLRSAHVYHGIDDGSLLASFKVQYQSGASWLDVPGSARAGVTVPEVNVVFSSAITSDRFRLYTDEDGNERVKEFALFPPNPNPTNGVELGFPIGTDVELSLAKKRPVVATATSGANYPKLAVDGFVSNASQWRTTLVGSNALEIDLRVPTKIGSAHLYSGDGGVPAIADFALQYWTGSAWANFGGGAVSGNTESARIITFSPEPTASKVRLVFTNSSVSVVRELCVFPANGGAGYPIGQDVSFLPPPAGQWNDYNDAYYHLRNRAADRSISVPNGAPVLSGVNDPVDQTSHYQMLLNVGTDTYRLRNRVTGKCLVGAGLSTNAGALLVDEDYTAMPHQNWRKVDYNGTDFFLLNEWTGLALDTQGGSTAAGTPLVQNLYAGTSSQRWRNVFQTRYPRKGSAGYVGNWSAHKSNWGYNWGRAHGGALPAEVTFNPMQWGNYNWDIGSSGGPLEQYLSPWQRENKSLYLLGFNEPDGADQSNLTVDQAIELWPRLERMALPLISPVTKNPFVSWMTGFMSQADSRGYQIDGVAVHKYPGPNGGDPGALISELQSVYNTWGRPVWFTEFSTVDWSNNGTWTEEDNYNWLAEFMWRAESLSWLRRYSLFLFTAGGGSPEPTNPWDPVAPRSNAFQSNGSTPTSFGELYFAWDCDANVRGDKAYFIHNKGERKRIRNASGSSVPDHGSIREGANATQWVLRETGVAGQWYISSLNDARRLRYSGGVVDFAPANSTGPAVTWSLTEDLHGWFYIENPAAPAANRRLKDIAGVFSMVSSANTGDPIKWRFIPPFAPVSTTIPAAPVNLNAFGGENKVTLTWGSGGTPNTTYWLYRGSNPGGPYSLIASNHPSIVYVDSTAAGGTTYFFVVTARDGIGNESSYSTEASATPTVPLPVTPTNLAYTVSNNTLVLSWPSNYTGWLLQVQTNALSIGLGTNWVTVPGSETNFQMLQPLDGTQPGIFYRLKRP